MTRPADLTGAARALFDDFRRVGLSESEALDAVGDWRACADVDSLRVQLVFNGLSESAARQRLLSIGRAAAREAEGKRRVPMSEAEFQVSLGGAFDRGVPASVLREARETVARREASVRLAESAGSSTLVRLHESATATAVGGRVRVRVIAPGQGSCGFYSAEMLKRDGPKVFVVGTQCFLDHPTSTEMYERPERSVRDLAGRLSSAARWEEAGPLGPGLYADVDLFGPHAAMVQQLGPYIGVSIRADGEIENGQVKSLTAAHSVDFVTRAGAGGAVLS